MPGGYGLLTRLMRDMGFDFYWLDPFAENFLARGFEYGDSQRKPNVVTAFEVFEHLFDPLQEIEKIVKLSPNILFSTELLPIPTPKPLQWWYYGLEHGQHVSFYRKETLTRIAAKFGLRFYSSGFINLFSDCVNFPSSVSYFTKVLRKFDRSFLLRTGPFLRALKSDFGTIAGGSDVLLRRVLSRGLTPKTDSDSILLGSKPRNAGS